jgi:hypothetical protein
MKRTSEQRNVGALTQFLMLNLQARSFKQPASFGYKSRKPQKVAKEILAYTLNPKPHSGCGY